MASGPLPGLRRGRRVLGAGRDGPARAGITEDDAPDPAREAAGGDRALRLRRARAPADRAALAHLLGLEQRTATEAADLFSGWRLFFERMATASPVILVFEDLQWADSGLLDFVDYLLEWSAEHPIFILALGRPELERGGPAGAPRSRSTLPPTRCTRCSTAWSPGLPARSSPRILERAEGVPLYAVETVRMLLDRGVLAQTGNAMWLRRRSPISMCPRRCRRSSPRGWTTSTPASAGCSRTRPCSDSFSPAAVAAVSGSGGPEVRRMLDALVAKQVLGHEDDQRSGEQGQYHFLQALLRTIALARCRAATARPATSPPPSTCAPPVATRPRSPRCWPATTSSGRGRARRCRRGRDSRPARGTLATAGTAPSRWPSVPRPAATSNARRARPDEPERAGLLAEAGSAAAPRPPDGRTSPAGRCDHAFDARGRREEAARTRALLADVLIGDNLLEAAATDRPRRRSLPTSPRALRSQHDGHSSHSWGDDYRGARDEAELALSIADPA